jgi:hypothetical protein
MQEDPAKFSLKPDLGVCGHGFCEDNCPNFFLKKPCNISPNTHRGKNKQTVGMRITHNALSNRF